MMTTKRSRAFTLVEMLVVISIIAVTSLIAVPLFRTLTGSRSTEAAHNQLAGLLGRARADAIGLQEIRGVAFFLDPETQRVQAIIVRQAQYPTNPPARAADLYLDYAPDREPLLLPEGVGVQMIDDSVLDNAGVRQNDAYIGFNSTVGGFNGMPLSKQFTFGGVILFDGYGRVISKRYGFKFFLEDGIGGKSLSGLAKAWGMVMSPSYAGDVVPGDDTTYPRSQFGFVAFNSEEYGATITGTGNVKDMYEDPQITTTVEPYTTTQAKTGMSELAEEAWLDANSIPQLVNRNNGTLLKGE